MTWDAEIDARGLLCPLPVLKARRRLRELPGGAVLRLVADDPAAVVDVPHFCRESGHELLGRDELGDRVSAYLIRRGVAVSFPGDLAVRRRRAALRARALMQHGPGDFS